MSVPLIDIASVIRSKNAGPKELTLDIMFKSRDWYEKVKASGAITRELIAKLYGQPESAVQEIIAFDAACAIKATLTRPITSGDVGDSDVYGAQQHAPLLGLVLEGID